MSNPPVTRSQIAAALKTARQKMGRTEFLKQAASPMGAWCFKGRRHEEYVYTVGLDLLGKAASFAWGVVGRIKETGAYKA